MRTVLGLAARRGLPWAVHEGQDVGLLKPEHAALMAVPTRRLAPLPEAGEHGPVPAARLVAALLQRHPARAHAELGQPFLCSGLPCVLGAMPST
jgi:hypothetical protein